MDGKGKHQLYKGGYLGRRRKREEKEDSVITVILFISLNKKGSEVKMAKCKHFLYMAST